MLLPIAVAQHPLLIVVVKKLLAVATLVVYWLAFAAWVVARPMIAAKLQ
jgi:hypothetical protein